MTCSNNPELSVLFVFVFPRMSPDFLHLYSSGLSRFHQEPSPQTVPAGGAARFECQIEGIPTPVITWEKDRIAVPEDTR